MISGIDAFLEILQSAGLDHIFGNPGTTELPLMDALADDSRFRYIFGLHEIPVVAAADGYAQASGKLGVVNVHISCGLGNAMGMLYNAHCSGTPLLLTVGQQDRRLLLEEPVLAADLVRVVQPWTKWAFEVHRTEDIPAATRRAIQTALTPPTGPVFLSMPIDLQMEKRPHFDLSPMRLPSHRVRPGLDELQRAAELLLSAKNPAILAGSRVTESGGIDELIHVAELLGAQVLSESHTAHGRMPFPCNHSLYLGMLPLWSGDVHELLSQYDVLLVVGVDLLRQYLFHEPNEPIPKHVKIIQIDNQSQQLNKNYPAELAMLGDPKSALGELASLISKAMNSKNKSDAVDRTAVAKSKQQASRDALTKRAVEENSARPMTPLAVMAAVAKVLPPNVAVVQEAITTAGDTLERLGAIKDPAGYFGHRGWALGWGLGCALGVKLAWPDRPALCLLGEGSALYGIQGLWTAAHHRIPVTFVICNNAQYKILKDCATALPLGNMEAGKYLGMDLTDPEIDFVSLARSFGINSQRVTEPDALSDLLQDSLNGDQPLLIDVPVAR